MADETNDSGASALDDLKSALDDLQLIDADRKRATKRVRDVLRRSKLDLDFVELTRRQWRVLDSVLSRMRREELGPAPGWRGKS